MVYSKHRSLALLMAALLIFASMLPAMAEEAAGAKWSISVESFQVVENLNTTQQAVQYDGDISLTDYAAIPADGNVYVLLEMLIEKIEAGKGTFAWSQLSLVDEEGNAYLRHENDIFLESHNLKRIKSTDLTFGKNAGYVCFEIPEAAAQGELTLSYADAAGNTQDVLLEAEALSE